MYLSRAKQGAFSPFLLLYIIYLINKKWQGEKFAWGLRRILKMLLNSDNWGIIHTKFPFFTHLVAPQDLREPFYV